MPKVSVVVPTCNRPRLIGRTIRSILSQTFQDFEIIVVDDGMEISAEQEVKKFNDNRINYIRHVINKGGGAARNTGIRMAHGEYVAFLDDDDEWLPQKLELQIDGLDRAGKDVGFCFSAVENIYDNIKERSIVPDGENDYHELALASFKRFLTVTLVFKKAVFDKVGLFDEELPSHQEAEFMIRVTKCFKGIGINKPLVNVNMKSDHCQVGKNYSKKISGAERLIAKHIDEFNARPKILSKHYFQLGIYCRDNNEHSKASLYFLKAWSLNKKELRYFIHFFKARFSF